MRGLYPQPLRICVRNEAFRDMCRGEKDLCGGERGEEGGGIRAKYQHWTLDADWCTALTKRQLATAIVRHSGHRNSICDRDPYPRPMRGLASQYQSRLRARILYHPSTSFGALRSSRIPSSRPISRSCIVPATALYSSLLSLFGNRAASDP